MRNQQVLIDSLPQGKLSAGNYRLAETEIAAPKAGEVLVKTTAFAITAGTRAGLQGSASYAGAPTTGVVMNSTGVGEVIDSTVEAFSVGDAVVAPTGWQTLSLHEARALTKIDPAHNPVDYLGPMGVNGLTAYFGLLQIGKPKAERDSDGFCCGGLCRTSRGSNGAYKWLSGCRGNGQRCEGRCITGPAGF